ncbi:MAG: hypothetical protein ACREBO_11475 [Novosphingobium sp.]
MTEYLHPCGCMHRDRAGLMVDGAKPNFFAIGLAGAAADSAIEVEFLGNVYQEIEHEGVDSNGFQFAQLRVVFFSVWGDHPTLGRLHIIHDNSRPGTYARILGCEQGKQYPAIHTTHLNVVAYAENMPGMILQNRGKPLTFVSEPMAVWPPASNIYRLGMAIDFENRANPGDPLITVGKAPVYVESA